jgi:hypothetical protein
MAIISMMPDAAMDAIIVAGLGELLYECEKEHMEMSAIVETILEILDDNISMVSF